MDTQDQGQRIQVPVKWVDSGAVPTLSADEVFVQDLGDRVIISVGQLRLPFQVEAPPESVDVVVTSRLQFTKHAFERISELFARLGGHIR